MDNYKITATSPRGKELTHCDQCHNLRETSFQEDLEIFEDFVIKFMFKLELEHCTKCAIPCQILRNIMILDSR